MLFLDQINSDSVKMQKNKIAGPLQPVSLFARQNLLLNDQESDQFRFWVNASAVKKRTIDVAVYHADFLEYISG